MACLAILPRRTRSISRYLALAFLYVGLSAILTLMPRMAWAVPSFAIQTGQPCAACHVGALGPQLKPTGRDFKLYGYVASDNKPHFPPLAGLIETSFTHTNSAQPGATPQGFGANDNAALDQVSLFYAGRIFPMLGAFAEVTYDGVNNRISWDKTDIRHSREAKLFGEDMVYGLTLNNSPTVQDLWNSTPAWGFPYSASPIAPRPTASTLIDGKLAMSVVGLGAYTIWNGLLFLELDGYRGFGSDVRNALGMVPGVGADTLDGFAPYWRVALQHEFGDHYVEIGTYGIRAGIYPGGNRTAGHANRITDTAIDANYQWLGDTDNFVSAHATYIRESLALDASRVLASSNPSDTLRTFRADLSYSLDNTYTPTIQYFQTRGSNDAAYWGIANGSPNSEGWIAEIMYVPWGKADSPIHGVNGRISLQYVAYTKFDGSSQGASGHNTLFLNFRALMAFDR